jgi:hypothetical protein
VWNDGQVLEGDGGDGSKVEVYRMSLNYTPKMVKMVNFTTIKILKQVT